MIQDSTLRSELRQLIKIVERLRLCGWTPDEILEYEDRDRRWLKVHGYDPDYCRLFRDGNDEILGVILGTPQIFVQEAS